MTRVYVKLWLEIQSPILQCQQATVSPESACVPCSVVVVRSCSLLVLCIVDGLRLVHLDHLQRKTGMSWEGDSIRIGDGTCRQEHDAVSQLDTCDKGTAVPCHPSEPNISTSGACTLHRGFVETAHLRRAGGLLG